MIREFIKDEGNIVVLGQSYYAKLFTQREQITAAVTRLIRDLVEKKNAYNTFMELAYYAMGTEMWRGYGAEFSGQSIVRYVRIGRDIS